MSFKNFLTLFTLGLIVSAAAGRAVTSGQAARRETTPAASQQSKPFKIKRPASHDPRVAAYVEGAREKLYAGQFSWLEDEARKVRASKERMPGGSWKLNLLYMGLSQIEYDPADDEDWQARLALLRKWVAQRPQSITAKVGLAEALISYGWHARGSGFAYKVTEEGWKLFGERLTEAARVLDSARASAEKCPQWYLSMLNIAHSAGSDPEEFGRLFAEAASFEPDYYYYYRVAAADLLPRWGGEPGDWERFASEAARRLGGERGDIVFFLIYANMISYHDLDFMKDHRAALPQVLAGFRALEKRFGESPVRLNEACLLAASAGDARVAKELFTRIGDAPDFRVWRTGENFEMYHRWATGHKSKGLTALD